VDQISQVFDDYFTIFDVIGSWILRFFNDLGFLAGAGMGRRLVIGHKKDTGRYAHRRRRDDGSHPLNGPIRCVIRPASSLPMAVGPCRAHGKRLASQGFSR
jgi:hypothetical protein